MSANINVFCRFRPQSGNEKIRDKELGASILNVQDNNSVAIEGTDKIFSFDKIFNSNSTQQDVFEQSVLPLVDSVFNGFNVTVFAYGQTASGKTYTMLGDDSNLGIIPRMTSKIFDMIDQSSEEIEFTIKLSYIEIYNERLQDLLDPSKKNLRIRESPTAQWVDDATEVYVADLDGINAAIKQGNSNRQVEATQMSNASSRSHAVMILTLGQNNQKTGMKKGSKIFLVDLAGSEQVSKTNASGKVLTEAKNINRSLSELGNVILKLTTPGNTKQHIPYRNSKLTRLLQDALGGNSRTCLIITCSPAMYNIEETISTLRFGTRAKLIKNKPKANIVKSVEEYKRMLLNARRKSYLQDAYITELNDEIKQLRLVEKVSKVSFPKRRESICYLSTLKFDKMSSNDIMNAVTSYKRLTIHTTLPNNSNNQNNNNYQNDNIIDTPDVSDTEDTEQQEEKLKTIQERQELVLAEQANKREALHRRIEELEKDQEAKQQNIIQLEQHIGIMNTDMETQRSDIRLLQTRMNEENHLLKEQILHMTEKYSAEQSKDDNDDDEWKGKYERLEILYNNIINENKRLESERILSNHTLESNALRYVSDQKAANKRIKELELKLFTAENMCQRFLESGMYWRQQRKVDDANKHSLMKHIHGGRSKEKKTRYYNAMDVFF